MSHMLDLRGCSLQGHSVASLNPSMKIRRAVRYTEAEAAKQAAIASSADSVAHIAEERQRESQKRVDVAFQALQNARAQLADLLPVCNETLSWPPEVGGCECREAIVQPETACGAGCSADVSEEECFASAASPQLQTECGLGLYVVFLFFTFLLSHSNNKNITRIARLYRTNTARKSTLEYKLDSMTKTRTPMLEHRYGTSDSEGCQHLVESAAYKICHGPTKVCVAAESLDVILSDKALPSSLREFTPVRPETVVPVQKRVIFGPCNPRLSTETSRPQRTVSQTTTESPWDSHRVPPQVRNGLWSLS